MDPQVEEDDLESLEMSQAVWNTDGALNDLNTTLIDDLARSFNETELSTCDIEDLFKS